MKVFTYDLVASKLNDNRIEMLVAAGLLYKLRAEKIDKKYKKEAIPKATGTEANSIQITRSGIASGLFSITARYMQTPS